MRIYKSLMALTALALAVVLTGCGGGGGAGGAPGDADQIKALVGGLNEASRYPDEFAKSFSGTAPNAAEQKKYNALQYRAAGEPTISGTEAKIKVIAEEGASGKAFPEIEWTAVKEGDKWKLKNAPLPQ